MRKLIISVPFAIVVGTTLVALGAVIATAPGSAGLWISNAVAGGALFAGIMYVGVAVRHHRRDR